MRSANNERWTKAQQYEIDHWMKLLKQDRPLDWYDWKAKELEAFLDENEFGHVIRSPGIKILEIGSGPVGTISALKQGEKFALEPLHEIFEECESFGEYRKFSVKYINGVGEDVPFPDEYFDLIIIDNVLDHTRDPEQVLRELRRVVRKDGVIFFALNVRSRAGLYVRNILEKLFQLDKGHPHSYDMAGLKRLIRGAGLKIRAERIEKYSDSILRDLKENTLRTVVKCLTFTCERLYQALLVV